MVSVNEWLWTKEASYNSLHKKVMADLAKITVKTDATKEHIKLLLVHTPSLIMCWVEIQARSSKMKRKDFLFVEMRSCLFVVLTFTNSSWDYQVCSYGFCPNMWGLLHLVLCFLNIIYLWIDLNKMAKWMRLMWLEFWSTFYVYCRSGKGVPCS